MNDNQNETQAVVSIEEYNKVITMLFYLFNLSIDFAKGLEIDLENSGVKIETTIGTLPLTSILNVFHNIDNTVRAAMLSEGFKIIPLEPIVTLPEDVEQEDTGLIVPPLRIVQ